MTAPRISCREPRLDRWLDSLWNVLSVVLGETTTPTSHHARSSTLLPLQLLRRVSLLSGPGLPTGVRVSLTTHLGDCNNHFVLSASTLALLQALQPTDHFLKHKSHHDTSLLKNVPEPFPSSFPKVQSPYNSEDFL